VSFGNPGCPDNRMQNCFRYLVLNSARLDGALKNVGGLASRGSIAIGEAGEEAEGFLECLFVNHLSPSNTGGTTGS
jgi:hypothetical protein